MEVFDYFNPQVFLLHDSFPTMTINKREQLIQLDLRFLLTSFFCDSFQLRLKTYRFTKTKYTFIPATYLLENGAKCDKKAVTATSLEDQPCQIQPLITDDQRCCKCNKHSNHTTQVQVLQELSKRLQIWSIRYC